MVKIQPKPNFNLLCTDRIPRIKLVISPPLLNELIMRSALDDASLLEYHDAVGIAHRREPVGDHERRAAAHEAVHAVLHDALRARIDRARCLVEDQHGRIGDRGPSDREKLPLALA